MNRDIIWVDFTTLENFMVDTFKEIGVPADEAKIGAEVLLAAD